MWPFVGLPGGSPGPGAEASGRTLLFVAIFALVAGGLMLWGLLYAARYVGA